ncbi:MAG: hypothetical protein WBV39_07410 [Rudaea sp.]
MRQFFSRGLAFAPDAITTCVFLTAWIAPALLGPEQIKNLLLVMMIEFLIVQSSGLYAGILYWRDGANSGRSGLLVGMCVVYMLFAAVFALIYSSLLPVVSIGWLLMSRFLPSWIDPSKRTLDLADLLITWVVSTIGYMLAAVATLALPLPHLGMTPQVIAALHLPGGGEWIERPYTVLAFGTVYFGVRAWAQYYFYGSAERPKSRRKHRSIAS